MKNNRAYAQSKEFTSIRQTQLMIGVVVAGGIASAWVFYLPLLVLPIIFGCGLIVASARGNPPT